MLVSEGTPSDNTAPYFLTDLPPLIDATAGENNFEFELDIPEIFDEEGDQVTMTFDYAALTGYLKYDE